MLILNEDRILARIFTAKLVLPLGALLFVGLPFAVAGRSPFALIIITVLSMLSLFLLPIYFSYYNQLSPLGKKLSGLVKTPLIEIGVSFLFSFLYLPLLPDLILFSIIYLVIFYLFFLNNWLREIVSNLRGVKKQEIDDKLIKLKRSRGISLSTQEKIFDLFPLRAENLFCLIDETMPLEPNEGAVIENAMEILVNSDPNADNYDELLMKVKMVIDKISKKLTSEKVKKVKEEKEIGSQVNEQSLEEMDSLLTMLDTKEEE